MPSNSRYMRLLRGAGLIQVAAQDIKKLPEGQLERAMALTRAKAKIASAQSLLQVLATDCAVARGMYASNKSIRDAITSAGLAITHRLPMLSKVSEELDAAAKDESYDTAKLSDDISAVAIDFATISFTPQSAAAMAAPADDNLQEA